MVEQFYIKQNPLWFQCFALGSYEKFQPGFWDQKKGKDPGDEFGREIRETKQTSRNTKIWLSRSLLTEIPIWKTEISGTEPARPLI